MHNSNKKLIQSDLFGNKIFEKWNFIGVFSESELRNINEIPSDLWYFKIDNVPIRDGY